MTLLRKSALNAVSNLMFYAQSASTVIIIRATSNAECRLFTILGKES